eukprot:CAMPEP_0117789950 /NCGR_PEP_ID=MMETSP0948-20121206/7931_1 /TAXON_ID=44440 /ORGANISM="Chattonella subsalsa, Strain CCMP2191" /LENGTH=537 /DNA_ID=CAMNT_0005619639 /DNA_START=79 /DNA_END=1692 /DNA_ORIENTATION=-
MEMIEQREVASIQKSLWKLTKPLCIFKVLIASSKDFWGRWAWSSVHENLRVYQNFLLIAYHNEQHIKASDAVSFLNLDDFKMKFDLDRCIKKQQYTSTLSHVHHKGTVFALQFSSQSDLVSFSSLLLACQRKMSLPQYNLVCTIGRGKFGKVVAAIPDNLHSNQEEDKMVAIKEIDCSGKSSIKHILQERLVIEILAQNPSPFVIQTMHALKSGTHLYYVMELMRAGDLYSLLSQFSITLSAARFYASEVLCALEHLHHLNIVYRDLKPENILVDDTGHIKLADFGLAKYLSIGETTRTCCGTESYTPPEMLHKKGYRHSVDFWQFGCILYELFVGKSPFYCPNISRSELKSKILSASFQFPETECSTRWKSVISLLLTAEPSHRLGVSESDKSNGWSHVRAHPFFNSLDWNQIRERSNQAPITDFQIGDEFFSNFDEEFTSEDPMFAFNDSETTPHEKELQSFDFQPIQDLFNVAYEIQTTSVQFTGVSASEICHIEAYCKPSVESSSGQDQFLPDESQGFVYREASFSNEKAIFF